MLNTVSPVGIAAQPVVQPLSAPRDSSWERQIRPGVREALPVSGELSALVIFIQHRDVPDQAGEMGDDLETEWPYPLSLDSTRLLPVWARNERLVARPFSDPAAFEPGSLSAFYHLMSHGRFTVTGYVYPRVIVPDYPLEWYHNNRGTFQNGAVRLAHDILTSGEIRQYLEENPDGIDLRVFDRLRNGTGEYVPDGVFDLIMFVDRGITLPDLRRDYKGRKTSGSSITSFGVDADFRPDFIEYRNPGTDAFASEPVTLAGLRVIDNLTSGSGIRGTAVTRKQAVRILAHEIGHRQLGFYHTCESPRSTDTDCIGIMGGAYVTMSAPDRIKLGWAEVEEIDVHGMYEQPVEFREALSSGKVYRLKNREAGCGDVVVEARTWDNFWDAPPNPDDPAGAFYRNDDGDTYDLFLPQEGLYLYKSPQEGNGRCGGSKNPDYDYAYFSSLENSGESTRLIPFRDGRSDVIKAFRPGGTYTVAYGPGKDYAPYTKPEFGHHVNGYLDERLSITGIAPSAHGYQAQIWMDFFAGKPESPESEVFSFPDPARNAVYLDITIDQTADVEIRLYDLLGREVLQLAAGRYQDGKHRIRVDVSRLAMGMYFWKVDAGDGSFSGRMHVVR